jgi:hypothetical protein
MIKKITLFISLSVLFLTSTHMQGQKRKKDIIYQDKTIGVAVMPSLMGRFLKDPNNIPGYSDSVRSMDKLKTELNFGLNFRFKTGRNWLVTTGIYYNKMGFTRVQDKINLLDIIHPNMPIEVKRITDVQQGLKTEIHYNNNYHFIDIPVLFGKDLTTRDMKDNDINLSWFFGGSMNGLVKHNMYIDFKGFTPSALKYYDLRDTDLKPLQVNISAIIGGRVDVEIYPKTRMYFQPFIQKQLFYASYGKEMHHLYALSAEIGISYSLEEDKKDAKKKKN